MIVNSYQPDVLPTPQPSVPGHIWIPLESKHNMESECNTWCSCVRELPPPTPREAYLPQRLEYMHTRGNNGETKQAQ